MINTHTVVYGCSDFKRPKKYRFTPKRNVKGGSCFVEARKVILVEVTP